MTDIQERKNPYATSPQVSAASSTERFGRVLRLVLWTVTSALLLAVLRHPRFRESRLAMNVAVILILFLPYVMYETFCRVSPRSTTRFRSIVDSLGRFVLTYALPYIIGLLLLYLLYFLSYASLPAWPQLSTPPHDWIASLAYGFSLLSIVCYDHWLAHYRAARPASAQPAGE